VKVSGREEPLPEPAEGVGVAGVGVATGSLSSTGVATGEAEATGVAVLEADADATGVEDLVGVEDWVGVAGEVPVLAPSQTAGPGISYVVAPL
jgi:hypothetical protein